LRQQPGIVITSFHKYGGRYRVQGLRDPLAANPAVLLQAAKLNPALADFHWAAFYALDDSLVLTRAVAILQPPATVTLTEQNGALRAAGDSTSEWKKSLEARAPLIPGISAVDDKDLNDENSPGRLKAALESRIVLFDVARAEISSRQEASLAQASHEIRALLQQAQTSRANVVVEVVGRADSSGAESTNVLLSQQRAENAVRGLVRLGIPPGFLRATGLGLSSPLRPETDEQNRQYNRSVTFRVVGLVISPSR
jgi:outer membrane protein OmpA-like peptidoglycan-associated protein